MQQQHPTILSIHNSTQVYHIFLVLSGWRDQPPLDVRVFLCVHALLIVCLALREGNIRPDTNLHIILPSRLVPGLILLNEVIIVGKKSSGQPRNKSHIAPCVRKNQIGAGGNEKRLAYLWVWTRCA